jgi:hypothetical protein
VQSRLNSATAHRHSVTYTQVAPIPFRTWVGPTWGTKNNLTNAAIVDSLTARFKGLRGLARVFRNGWLISRIRDTNLSLAIGHDECILPV